MSREGEEKPDSSMETKGSVPLRDRFVSEITNKILSGELKPGERLLPERELAKEMGMSRSSVNQGILALERSGYLRIVPRKGTFVRDILNECSSMTLISLMETDTSGYHNKLLLDLMDMRILVERECTRLASIRCTSEDAQILWHATAEIFRAKEDAIPEALYQYHLTIVKMAGNAVYQMLFQSFEKTLKNLMGLHYKNRMERTKSQPKFEELTRLICQGKAKEAEEKMLEILGQASDYLVKNQKEAERHYG